MNLLKLNRQYSIIIFFFNILVIFSVSKFLEIKNITIPYQTVICFFLISIIGVSHGALDHVKGSQLMKIYKVKNNFYFYLVYIFLSLLVILCWTILPLFTLIIFLLVIFSSNLALANNKDKITLEKSMLIKEVNYKLDDTEFYHRRVPNYKIYATKGTAALLRSIGLETVEINKVGESSPNAYSVVVDGVVDAVINTVEQVAQSLKDGFEIRRSATERRIPCYTSTDTARAAIEALVDRGNDYNVASIVEYVQGELNTVE